MTSYRTRLACHTIGWFTPLDRVFQEIRGLGFVGVELATHQLARGFEHEVGTLLDSYELAPVAVYHSVRLCCERNLALEFTEAHRAIELAACVGTSMVVLGSPPGHRIHTAGSLGLLADHLNELGAKCSARGLSLAYQPHFGGPVEGPEEIDELLEKTDPHQVRLCLDTAHILWGGGDPSRLMEKHKDRIGYIHLKDLRWNSRSLRERLLLIWRYVKLGQLTDYRQAARPLVKALIKNTAPDFAELGRGSLDLRAFWKAVRHSGYEGWITIELDQPSLVARESARQSLNYVRKICML